MDNVYNVDGNIQQPSLSKELKEEKKYDKQKTKEAIDSVVNIIKNNFPDNTKFLVLTKNSFLILQV